MKLSITIVLLSIASYAFAQSPNRDSRSTRIDENEKKRLENQFKALNTFYINDDGLVVYQTQENSTSQKEEEKKTTSDTENNISPQTAKTEKSDDSYLVKEDRENTVTTAPERPLSKPVALTEAAKTEAPSQDRTPVRSSIIRKEALKPTETLSNKETASNNITEANAETEIKSTAIKNSPITLASEERHDNAPKPSTSNNKVSTETNKTTQTTATSKKSSVFNKNKYTPQYKTMEEAALAVEALLEDLRKEQAQTTSAGSMSSRLSGGAGRATLRKKPATSPSYTNNNDSYSTMPDRATIVNDETSEFGNEPTYFINGKEVDKIEVNRLRRKEIINKEVRTRNTVSGNPNGEVWYEVKYDN